MNWSFGKYKMGRKYGFWDVSRDRKKKPITLSDRLLELVAAAWATFNLVLTGIMYGKAADKVPSHFNFSGEADGWSDKSEYWIIAGVMLVAMLISAAAAYNRKMVNLPIRLKPAVFYRQIGLIGRMCRVLTLVIGVLWTVIILAMSPDVVWLSATACSWMFSGSTFLILGVCMFYTLKIWWIGRGQ